MHVCGFTLLFLCAFRPLVLLFTPLLLFSPPFIHLFSSSPWHGYFTIKIPPSFLVLIPQLLRRSLDSHALQIARACVHLAYFAHMLELLLHEVLEEEAVNDLAVVREGE
jgi:hypothetical protein